MRFTIRDVLWLTLVVGLVVGWWVDRSEVARRRDLAQRDFIASKDMARDLRLKLERELRTADQWRARAMVLEAEVEALLAIESPLPD